MIFANKTSAAVWKENWCDRCFDPAQAEQRLTGRGRGCMILNAAMVNVTTPAALTKGRSGAMMSEAYRCTQFADKPTSTRPRAVPFDTDDGPGLFDAPALAVLVDGDHS